MRPPINSFRLTHPTSRMPSGALRHPAANLWHGFAARALIFGSTTAGLHYNAMSRILVALENSVLEISLAW